MVILKKMLTRSNTTESEMFPKLSDVKVENKQSHINSKLFIEQLASSPELLENLTDVIVNKLLKVLESKYGFEPTNKYLEEIENKKKYINQLDTYLDERREIKETVENELQVFLQETSTNLSKALEGFSLSIQQRIKAAENKYGIDMIKESLLSDSVRNEK